MTRLEPLSSAEQYFERYPTSDPDERARVEDVYERNPWLKWHPNFSMFAHDLRLAELMMELTRYLLYELDWTKRDVSMLSTLVCDVRVKGQFEDAFMAHFKTATEGRRGEAYRPEPSLTWQQIAALDFKESGLFSEEQRLVIEFTERALDGTLSDDLFEELCQRYGDRTMLEWAVSIAFFTMFPYLINLFRTDAAARPGTKELWGQRDPVPGDGDAY
jgi:hypothetical protein